MGELKVKRDQCRKDIELLQEQLNGLDRQIEDLECISWESLDYGDIVKLRNGAVAMKVEIDFCERRIILTGMCNCFCYPTTHPTFTDSKPVKIIGSINKIASKL